MKHLLFATLFATMNMVSYTAMAQQGTNTLSAGQKLTEGQRLISTNKVYYLAMQADGNLCLKKTKGDEFVWCSMVYLGRGHYLILQTDGNLVVYNKDNKPVWSSMTQAFFDPKFGTADWKPVRAVLEDNGTFNLYSATNKKVWSNADKKAAPIASPGVGFTGPTVVKSVPIKLPGSKSAANLKVEITNTGEVFYNGDINLGTLESLTQQASSPSPPKPNDHLWPNSTVPYLLPANHPRKNTIQKAIDYMNEHTNVCLVPRTNQKGYIEFISENGNWADIGYREERRRVSVQDDNISLVIHEVMHSLGFYHTHVRQDRDKYVTVNMSNVEKGQEHNFEKTDNPQSNLGVYDYTSCMHYWSGAFAAKEGTKTIVRKDGKTEEMGRLEGMSETDIANIAAVYQLCPGKPGAKPVATTTPTPTPTPTPTTTPTATPATTACGLTIKYQGSMTPGSSLSEKEALVSANGRYWLRYDRSVGHVIEEVLNSSNCQFKQVYSFAGIIAGQYIDNNAKNQPISFNYESNGDILLTYPRSSGRFSQNAVSPDKHRGAPQVNVVGKSTRLELTNDGKLRLVNNSGQDVWGTTPDTPACGITIKYNGFMTPGSMMLENEALVSANGRYWFRNKDGSYVIEEVLNRNTCQFKQVYNFTLVVTLSPYASTFNGGKRAFSYTKEGDILYIPNISLGKFSDNPKNPSQHRDSPKVNVVGKSTKFELTNEGILRLVNNNGQVIWTTTGHDK